MFIFCLLRSKKFQVHLYRCSDHFALNSVAYMEFSSEVLPSLVIEARVDGEKARTGYGGETWEKEIHLQDLGVDGRIILKMDLQEIRWRIWNWLLCLRVGKSEGLLWMR
jgi:hypothetical protein